MHNPTDQKVGGSNPSGRAHETRCAPMGPDLTSVLNRRLYPNKHPNCWDGDRMPDRRSRDAVPTVDHDLHVVVGRYGNVDLGCRGCGSSWARIRSADGAESGRSLSTGTGKWPTPLGTDGPPTPYWCDSPAAPVRVSPWPTCWRCG
jgi:hypothetical protein